MTTNYLKENLDTKPRLPNRPSSTSKNSHPRTDTTPLPARASGLVANCLSVIYVADRGQPVEFEPGLLASGGESGFALAVGGGNGEAGPMHSI